MWRKDVWIEHSVRLQLTREGVLVKLANQNPPQAPNKFKVMRV